ncbi:MAG: hypothetical protein ACRDZ2_13690, partial [Ilumatobacteraceae bacterium]
VDIDPVALAAARRQLPDAELLLADALGGDVDALAPGTADLVVGNPPFLSQLAATTTRRGASAHGGGPYADTAAEFLAVAIRAARPDGGRVGLVLPQSLLASRDAGPVRAEVDRLATMTWSWWSPRQVFDDARVLVCALAFERRPDVAPAPWTAVITGAMGVPALPALTTDGRLGDHARLTANFRDEYYALVPAVVEAGAGAPLITSGLIDPGRCRWGERSITFARRRLGRPSVERDLLTPAMQRWADDLLVPKVLIANQCRVIEAVVDETGSWLPGVPVITARPADATAAWKVAAVLTSPVASAWAWRRAAGTGRSASSLRLGPRWLADLPWPGGSLQPAVDALRAGDLAATGRGVSTAYGVGPPAAAELQRWWVRNLPG